MTPEKDQGKERGEEQEQEQEEPTEAEPEDLPAQLEEALREKDQFRNLAQRIQADFINYKRRMEEERKNLERSANAGLILKVLSIADDFQRALSHLPKDDVTPEWLEGIQLIQRRLEAFLESEGVSRIEALGADFNPEEHEAVFSQVSSNDEEGKVMSVIREGYKLHGKVLRPAQVSVGMAKGGLEEPKSSDTSE